MTTVASITFGAVRHSREVSWAGTLLVQTSRPRSDPASIYQNLCRAVAKTDEHDSKINSQKAILSALAVNWFAAGEINEAQRDEIVAVVNKARFPEWRPLIFVVPYAKVEGRVIAVPRDERPTSEPEYIIPDLRTQEFEHHRARHMNFDVLEHLDEKTANGILAAAALSLGPTTPEPPTVVVRNFAKEADALIKEIRQKLRLSTDDISQAAHSSIHRVLLARELRDHRKAGSEFAAGRTTFAIANCV